jgi:long-subunit fatty acid transport protein
VLAGYAYETAAAPDALLSVLTVDGARHLFAGGLAYRFGRTEVVASFAHVAVAERHVSPEVGVAEQLTPIREPEGEPMPTYVNWGDYRSSWLMAGAGIRTSF